MPTPTGSARFPSIRRAPLALIAVATLAMAAVLAFLGYPDVRAVALAVVDMDQSAGPDRGVNLTEVARHPEVMVGRVVTISGRVLAPPGERVATIGSSAPFVGDAVTVVAPGGFAALHDGPDRAPPAEGDLLRVEGIVLLRDDAPAEIAPLLAGSAASSSGVLLARSVAVNPSVALGAGDKELPAQSDGFDLGLTAYDIANHADRYLGQTVTISGEVEEAAMTERAFVVSDHAVLVVTRRPDSAAFVEATAYVTGEVRRFDRSRLEAELGVALDPALDAWRGKPMILADRVEVVA